MYETQKCTRVLSEVALKSVQHACNRTHVFSALSHRSVLMHDWYKVQFVLVCVLMAPSSD